MKHGLGAWGRARSPPRCRTRTHQAEGSARGCAWVPGALLAVAEQPRRRNGEAGDTAGRGRYPGGRDEGLMATGQGRRHGMIRTSALRTTPNTLHWHCGAASRGRLQSLTHALPS